MRSAVQHLNVDARSPHRVSFDGKAAGASDIILRTLRTDPQRASDLAAEMLKVADPARHIQRLLAIKRAKGGPDPTD